MKRKLPIISVVMVVLFGIMLMFNQTEKMKLTRILEEKRQEVLNKLVNDLSYFNPVLAAFVDSDYKTTIASKISPEGIVVLVPDIVPDDWPLEIKTYPRETGTNFTSFNMHCMDYNDEKMMVSITQKKSLMK